MGIICGEQDRQERVFSHSSLVDLTYESRPKSQAAVILRSRDRRPMRVPEPARRPSVSPSLFTRNSSISRMLSPVWRDATRRFGAACAWMRRGEPCAPLWMDLELEFDIAVKSIATGANHHRSVRAQHRPSRLVGTQLHLPLRLGSRDPDLVVHEKLCRGDPIGQRRPGAMEDRAGRRRDSSITAGTAPAKVRSRQPALLSQWGQTKPSGQWSQSR